MKFKVIWNDQRYLKEREKGFSYNRIDCVIDNKIAGHLVIKEFSKKRISFPQFLCYEKQINHPIYLALKNRTSFVSLSDEDIFYYENLNLDLKALKKEYLKFLKNQKKSTIYEEKINNTKINNLKDLLLKKYQDLYK